MGSLALHFRVQLKNLRSSGEDLLGSLRVVVDTDRIPDATLHCSKHLSLATMARKGLLRGGAKDGRRLVGRAADICTIVKCAKVVESSLARCKTF